jgi:hypothetical protein
MGECRECPGMTVSRKTDRIGRKIAEALAGMADGVALFII